MRTDDGHIQQYYLEGGYGEQRGFEIWHNAFISYDTERPDSYANNPPCKHAGPVQTESFAESGQTVTGFRIPKLAVTYNQAGYDCTGICAECILEALKVLPCT